MQQASFLVNCIPSPSSELHWLLTPSENIAIFTVIMPFHLFTSSLISFSSVCIQILCYLCLNYPLLSYSAYVSINFHILQCLHLEPVRFYVSILSLAALLNLIQKVFMFLFGEIHFFILLLLFVWEVCFVFQFCLLVFLFLKDSFTLCVYMCVNVCICTI